MTFHKRTLLAAIAAGAMTGTFLPAQAMAGICQNNSTQRAEQAPVELAFFGQMTGTWNITDETLQQDGKTWKPGAQGAQWSFCFVLDGWMIADEWISPAPDVQMEDESKRQRGINLRIYDKANEQWVMTWLTARSQKPQNFTAVSDGKQLVMSNEVRNKQGKWTRITFHNVTDKTFEWKMDWSKDKENWTTVYRIHGTRVAE